MAPTRILGQVRRESHRLLEHRNTTNRISLRQIHPKLSMRALVFMYLCNIILEPVINERVWHSHMSLAVTKLLKLPKPALAFI